MTRQDAANQTSQLKPVAVARGHLTPRFEYIIRPQPNKWKVVFPTLYFAALIFFADEAPSLARAMYLALPLLFGAYFVASIFVKKVEFRLRGQSIQVIERTLVGFKHSEFPLSEIDKIEVVEQKRNHGRGVSFYTLDLWIGDRAHTIVPHIESIERAQEAKAFLERVLPDIETD